ncbi:hypothetical protein DLREEDagrD3_11500 [Denitratisoma sp. agr-D3]
MSDKIEPQQDIQPMLEKDGELSDSQLEKVAAGSTPMSHGPSSSNLPKNMN